MSRQIRVFLSSTFRDMQQEREALIKQVFPGLRRLCRDRGVDLVEVDLRWGITEDQAEQGEVLPLCIREIERCRPYFVAILGERYGWVPDSVPDEPWALEGASVTHMEIHWAALKEGTDTDRSFFFFRRGAEGPEPQQALKAEIEQRGLQPSHYDDPEDLASQVRDTLLAAIDADFPEDAERTWLDVEREEMAAFLRSRSRVYVSRPEWMDRLDEGSVIVTGPSGSGKSSLLANWAEQTEERTFVHFLGATARSAHVDTLVHRILAELADEVPSDPADHRAALAPCLAAAAPVTLVLDAVEHTDDLSWLPHPLPEGVRLVASGLPGQALDELLRRGYPKLELTPLTTAERRRIVVEALALHGKALDDERVERIAGAQQTCSPLFLRTLTEELRLWGDHEALDEHIDHLLSAPTVPQLFDRVLARLERDYEGDHPGMVGACMSALAAARFGLTEPELLTLLDVPALSFAPLSHALESSLVSRSGVLSFFHSGLQRAVRARYLTTSADLRQRRRQLVDFFGAQPMDERVCEELPWLQHEVGDLEGLTRTLTDLDVFLYHAEEAQLQDLVRWWKAVPSEPAAGYAASLSAYGASEPAPFEHAFVTHKLARFLELMADFDTALPLFEQARALYAEAVPPDDPNLGVVANDHALALFLAGRYQQAEPAYREAIRLIGDVPSVLHNLAEILLRQGRFTEALELSERAVHNLQRTFGRHPLTATTMQNLARAQMALGDLQTADATLTEALSIVDGPPTRVLAVALTNLAALRQTQGHTAQAEVLYRRSVEVSEQVLGPDHPNAASTLAGLGSVLFYANKWDESMAVYLRAIRLVETHMGPSHPNLGPWLTAVANLMVRQGRGAEAEVHARRAHRIACDTLGEASSDAGQAALSLSACAASRGDVDEAARLAFRSCQILSESLGPFHATTDMSWGMVEHLAISSLQNGDPARAEPLFRRFLGRLTAKLGHDDPRLGPTLWNLGQSLVQLGRPSEAISLFQRELAMAEASYGPNHQETVQSRKNLDVVRMSLPQGPQ
ncbi:MAG: tetratricopeptide repeat protein [Myxococcales bacterium]|nr:tetratricopeptide repeat protein [Myxococcales bacterium]